MRMRTHAHHITNARTPPLHLEVQPDEGEEEAAQVLDQVVEYPQALGVLAVLHVQQRPDLGALFSVLVGLVGRSWGVEGIGVVRGIAHRACMPKQTLELERRPSQDTDNSKSKQASTAQRNRKHDAP